MPRVFLSYARADGDATARRIRDGLAETTDIEVWRDREKMRGGVGFWKQITEAIDGSDFLILVATPEAQASGMVQKEWRYARQVGVCVYPVIGAPLDFASMPRWMRKSHFFDLDKEWPTFLGHLRGPSKTPRVPFMAPDLPERFVPRPHEFGELKKLLLDGGEPVAITTALSGAGGFGKTTLAAALCHDEDIQQNFDDGILWVTLGQTPDVIGKLVTAYAALTGERPAFKSDEDGAYQLGEKLEQRNCLLVIDDVWDASHLRPFLRGGKGSARLFTTRNTKIAGQARAVNVDRMRPEEGVAMLPELDRAGAEDVARKLGEWPLGLELASAAIRERVRLGDSPARAIQRVAPTIAEGVERIVETSLPDATDRRRFAELGIFPEDVEIPLTAARTAWGLGEVEAEEFAIRLARLSLLKLDLGRGAMRLHDVMRSRVGCPREVHERVIASWTDWRKLPDEYAWRWLSWHLKEAARAGELERLLWDPLWMHAKLSATDVNALLADYEELELSDELRLVRDALRLSSHVLAVDATQFASQMIGRLLPYRERLQAFLDEVPATAPPVWLRPMHPALHPPGTALVLTMAGGFGCVAVTPDGKWAVSASDDNTLTVWDLESGRALSSLQGHSGGISGVAVTPDGQRAVSSSFDKTLKIWDLQSGRALRSLEGHSDLIFDVTITSDGKRAVSASFDKTLKMWDLESGRELRSLEGHSEGVSGVAATPDGRRAVTASSNGMLKVWDLESGRELRSLEGNSGPVKSLAVTPDGARAVSASRDDNAPKIWDLESGRELRLLEGHSGGVNGVAVMPDGKRVVSASSDKTLKVWDLESGRELRSLEGHSGGVCGVAVTRDGKRAVSASSDNTLKVWDSESDSALRSLESHSGGVNSVAVTLDGKRTVSASSDKTLKVWDLKSGRPLRSLTAHSHWVRCVAVTEDGKRAVSASSDNTLEVWDLKSDRQLHSLEGHSKVVLGVAVTPDGKRAVSASEDKTLKVWDLKSGRRLYSLKGHSESVNGVAVLAGGKRAVSASSDKTLKAWDLESGRELRSLEGHSNRVNGVAVLAGGKRAVSASSDKTLKVWDLESGRELRSLEGHSGGVCGVAVTPNGKFAVSASNDKMLKLWHLESGEAVATFTCDAGVLCCAAGPIIVAGDAAGRVHFLALSQSP